MNTSFNHAQFEDPRDLIHRLDQEGLMPLKAGLLSRASQVLQGHQRGAVVSKELQLLVDRIHSDPDVERARARLKGMLRYLFEGGNYHADVVQLDHLVGKNVLNDGDMLVDLGTGSGEVVKQWAARGNPAIGVDASPSFVAGNELIRLGLIDDELRHLRAILPELAGMKRAFILSSLTLDRVSDPEEFVNNVGKLAGPEGDFAIASLFPLNPVDDEQKIKLKKRIHYTPSHLRIATSGNEFEDLANTMQLIERITGREVEESQVPYIVHTANGPQVYPNYHMITTKKR